MTAILCCVNIYAARSDGKNNLKLRDTSEANKTNETLQNNSHTFSVDTLNLQQDTKLVFAKVEEAKAMLTKKDTFIDSLSFFDRSARMKTDSYVSEEEFLQYIAQQIRPWADEEKQRLEKIVESVSHKLSPFKLNLPKEILLIKTTGKEEGNAAYCRSGAIVFPQAQLSIRDPDLENLLIHELFHIFSAKNPELKEAMYEIIHFKKCNNIKLPDILSRIKITNPDAPANDHYVQLQYNGGQVEVVPVIYASAPKYDVQKGGEFFRYLVFKLLVIEKTADQYHFKKTSDGQPILLDVREVPDYFNKIGTNTNYIIHPEEILAENFVLMVQQIENLKSKWVIEKMKDLLQGHSEKTRKSQKANRNGL